MKILFFTFLLSMPFAQAQNTECKEFTREVLTKPVTLLEKSDDHGNRFIKAEKEALPFIRAFEVKKLGLDEDKKLRDQWSKTCESMSENKNFNYCANQLETYNYFRALIHAVKNNSWSKQTNDLVMEKLNSYLDKVRNAERSLLDLTLIINLTDYAAAEKLLSKKVDVKKARNLKFRIEEENIKLRSKLHQMDSSCDHRLQIMKDEKELVKKYTEQFNQLFI